MPIVIDHGAMEAASAEIRQDAQYLQSVLDDLDGKIKALAANWEGDAQQAYLVAKDKWTKGMEGIRQTLADVSMLIAETNQSFTDIDKKGAAMWGA